MNLKENSLLKSYTDRPKVMDKEIREMLIELSEPERASFQKKILKTDFPLLGSTLGPIRKLAKSLTGKIVLSKQDPPKFYEELLLYGLILALEKRPIVKKNEQIIAYLDQIDSWALCDSFCSTFKLSPNEKQTYLPMLLEHLNSGKEFRQRFALVMLLSHYLKVGPDGEKLKRPRKVELKNISESSGDGKYLSFILKSLSRSYPLYNASMAAAWLGAETFLFFPDKINTLLEEGLMDKITVNRTIDKIIQSRNPTVEVKDYMRKKRSSLSKTGD